MDWSFDIDDPHALLKRPPAEVAAPLEAATAAFASAAATAREAADDLAESVRIAAAAGYGHSWICVSTGLAALDVKRLIAGENLY